MSEKTIMIIMGILTAGFLGVTAFHFVSSDHTAPKITIPDTEITYTEGDDATKLLEGVTANDNKNGDVSDYICIDTIVPNEEQKTATVVYAAYDFSNNVAKEKRTVHYVSVQQPDASAEEMPEEIMAEESEEETADDTEENTESAENTQVNPEAPILTMEVHEFTIQEGGPFTPKNRILSVEDDVDNSDYLISHLQVDGDYDVDTAGKYELTYYVVDSSGNESNHEPMTLIVEDNTNTQNTNTQNTNTQNTNTQRQTAPQSNPAATVTPQRVQDPIQPSDLQNNNNEASQTQPTAAQQPETQPTAAQPPETQPTETQPPETQPTEAQQPETQPPANNQ